MDKPIIDAITKDDTIVLECTIPEDITGWKIRAEIYDDSGNQIRLATVNTGGSIDQIEVILELPTKSIFEIKVPSGETEIFTGRANIEIEVDTSQIIAGKPEILTVFDGFIDFKNQKIKWILPTD